MEIKELYKEMKNIANEIVEFLDKEIQNERDAYKIATKIENEIKKFGYELAFPINICINEVAAHYTPEKKEIIKEFDLVKIDIGIHKNGYIFDFAKSYSIGKCEENEILIKAASEALSEWIKIAKSGTIVKEFGIISEEIAKKYGIKPIRNLGGHGIERYIIHKEPTILNSYNNNNFKLESGMIIALETFFTNGLGYVKDSYPSLIFEILDAEKISLIRDYESRKALEKIWKERKTLPFSKKFLNLNEIKANYLISEAIEKKIIKDYPVLKEVNNGKVAQFETTVFID